MNNAMLRKLPRRGAAVALLAIAGAFTTAGAQDRLDPVAMGKARASVASTWGIGAIASNPGRMDGGYGNESGLAFTVYNFGLTVGSTYLSSSDFEQIFGRTKGWPNPEDRAHLGELLQDERLAANGANDLFAMTYATPNAGTFGLHYGHRVYAKINFPADFNTVLVKGELLADHYSFINRGVGVSWMTELGLSYGKNIWIGSGQWFPMIGIGATAKLLRGVAQFEVVDNSILTVNTKTVNNARAYVVQGGFQVRSAEPDGFDPANAFSQFETALFPSTSGIGFGVDIGISGILYEHHKTMVRGQHELTEKANAINYGIVLQNVGSITWNRNTYERSLKDVNDTLPNGALTNEQFARYQGTLVKRGEYATPTPATLRAGFSVNVNAFTDSWDHAVTVDIEGEAPLNDAPGNPVDPRLAVGVSYAPSNAVSLLTGLSGGGTNGFGVGLGVGVQPFDWMRVDVGTSEINALFNGKRVDVAARLTILP